MIARIRLARENDTALLSIVERSAARRFQVVPGLEWVAEGGVLSEVLHLDCIRGGTCWVAVDEHDIPVGFLSAAAVAERELHIHEMSVSEGFQGHGIGRALLEAAIQWATIHRLTALTLTTFRAVPWNAPFYSRMGFKVLSVSGLEERLSALLRKEIEEGFAEGTRCAMRLSLDDDFGREVSRELT
jgi:GNAT superfamily N-acetyltransferase